jgi:hypothetical protein
MLRRLYRCAVRLHPSSFRRRFGEEMLCIFDQQRGTLAALDVTLDCVLSLLRQWTLRPHIDTELPAVPRPSPAADYIPSFETVDPFRPGASAIIHGALLSLILFYMTVFAIPYSWIYDSNLRMPGMAVDTTQPRSRDSTKSSERLQVDVIPTESDDPQRKTIASSSPPTPAAPVRTRGVRIWLDPYVGKYISNYPAAKISIQIEGDPLSGDHLSLSLAAAGHASLALSPVSPAKFVIVGAEDSYVDFTADAQGRICCLSFVVNGNAITAQRQ